MKMYILGYFLVAVAVIAAFSAGVMLLWNQLIPAVFGGTTITFWQTLGLLLLLALLSKFATFVAFKGYKHDKSTNEE